LNISTILIVEDSKDIIDLLKFTLKHKKHKILTATKAEEGLKLLRKNKVDLIILDIMLPNMSGI
jgi:DNA-binding response OmpR family regulator